MRRIHLALASACVLVTQPLYAQATTDTAAFRQGQWAVEFIPNRDVTEAGVLRFSTPSRAWVLDGSATFEHTTITSNAAPDQSTRSGNVSARLGPRWYHSEYDRVVRFAGVGLTDSYSAGNQAGPSTFSQDNWSAGVYGELGLQYLFTRHLGLGVRGEVVAMRDIDHVTGNNGTSHLTTDRVALAPLQIIGAFYF
jgi:outer membrane protein W